MFWIALSCSSTEIPEQVSTREGRGPDVLLVTIDTLRADRVGAYGDALARTPNMDALAREGALFRQAHAVAPLTLPSHASMLTGLLPRRHGIRDNSGFVLAPSVPTIAGGLQNAGYATAAFVSAYVLHHSTGLDSGFGHYHDPFHPMDLGKVAGQGEAELPSADTANAAAAWWREAESPKFAWVHLFAPHAPWDPLPGWEGDPYRGDVARADAALGLLLRDVPKEALVILASDHGEGLWEGGEREHGVLLGPGITRVPLIVRPPGGLHGEADIPPKPGRDLAERPAGTDPGLDLRPVPDAPSAALAIGDVVSGIDVASTIADYAGVSLPADGLSLRSLVEGGSREERPAYAETLYPFYHFGWQPLRMAQDSMRRLEKGAYVRSYLWETGDDVPPPQELEAFSDSAFGDGIPSPGPTDAETSAALEALGYLSSEASSPAGLSSAPDPRDRTDVLSELHRAEALPPDQAATALQGILEREPGLSSARLSLSIALSAAGRPSEALEACQELLALQPSNGQALNNASILARQAGKSELALGYADELRQLNPSDARGYRLAAAAHVDLEDPAGVIKMGESGLAVSPGDPNLHYLVGLAKVFTGRPADALPHLRQAREQGSRATDLQLWLGIASERSGDIDGALKHYSRATKEMGGDLRPWVMCGTMLASADRCAEARSFLVNAARRGAYSEPSVVAAFQRCGIGR
jgi:choline-sulfatase